LALLPFMTPAAAVEPLAKPIKAIVGTSAGGPADLLARLLGEAVSNGLGIQVVVENRSGASGTIAARLVSRAVPDGHSVLIAGIASMIAAPYVYPRLGYDPSKDLVPVTLLATASMVLVTTRTVRASTVGELAALAQREAARPMTYASVGNGSVNHLCAELFSDAAGIRMLQIPYPGDGPASNAVVAGDVQLMFMGPNVALPLLQSNRLHGLAVTGSRRLVTLPDVPTMEEAGFKGVECRPWTMAFVPAGTPSDKVERLSKAWAAALEHSDIAAKITAAGLEPPEGVGPLNAAAFLHLEQQRHRRALSELRAKAH
jgi:tripartite-type tricarboxylate transporter receptor subunit TctC